MRATYPPYLTAHLEDHAVTDTTTVQPIPGHMDYPDDGRSGPTTSGVLLDNDADVVNESYPVIALAPGAQSILDVGVAVLDALDQVSPVESGDDGPLYVQVTRDEEGGVLVQVVRDGLFNSSRIVATNVLMQRRVQIPAS